MRHYNFREIKERGSCIDFVEQIFGAKVSGGRCAAVWRQGERDSVAIDKDMWFDHVTNEGGGLIDLCAVSKFGGKDATAIQQAQEFLGDWLHLAEVRLRKAPASGHNRYSELIADGYSEKARYDYVDLNGKLVYSVYRMEHPSRKKEFLQGTPEHWGIADVTPIPYNWPAVHASDWAVIVEGEKDVETLKAIGIPATTNSGGAKKWRPEFADYLAGKRIIILPDNDEAGREHAELVARDLYGKATGIRIVQCSKLPKGDVTDYFTQEGGCWESLAQMISAAPDYEPAEINQVEAAKAANKKPFRNYTIEEKEIGRRKVVNKIPRQINELVRDLHTRLLGAPFKVGEQLFDQDRDTGRIDYIFDQSGLFSWIARKTGCTVDWARIDGCVTKAEFYEALRSEATEYSAISFAPDYPVRKDVFYTHPELPPPSENQAVFQGFVDFFNPDGEVNRCMLTAFIIAPIFYQPMVNRPLWIIDSPNGQGSGKSKIPEMVALLYGQDAMHGEPIDVSIADLNHNYSEVVKRIISTKGRNARILRIDNVTGVLRNSSLATLVTTGSITGRASYGRDEESRPNNLTYVVTVNGASVDTDIASRAYCLMVKKPKMDPNWVGNVIRYITENRLQIFADIIDILEKHVPYDIPPSTRMPKFETAVLQAACGSPELYQRVIGYLAEKKDETNTDEDLARRIEEEIELLFADTKPVIGADPINVRTDKVFIRNDALDDWFHGKSWIEKYPVAIIRNMAKTEMLKQVSATVTRYPHHSNEKINRRSGILWNHQLPGEPRVIGLKKKEIVEIINEQGGI